MDGMRRILFEQRREPLDSAASLFLFPTVLRRSRQFAAPDCCVAQTVFTPFESVMPCLAPDRNSHRHASGCASGTQC